MSEGTPEDRPDLTAPPASSPVEEEFIQPENPLSPVQAGDLPESLRKTVAKAGWKELTKVQSYSIPYLRAGRDIMIQSKTGSGKTGAFLLPILERLDPEADHCQALILVPTRELAQQVRKEAELLSSDTGIRTVAVYGGVGYGPQLEAFKKGAHLVVGTAGRILDHLIRSSLKVDRLKILVFDEADRMMSMGSYPDMREIASYLPKKRDSFMFSATYPMSVRRLANQFLRDPAFLSLSHDSIHATSTEHFFYEVPAMDRDRALVRLIEVENPESAIVFCNTKVRVNYLATVLQRFGYDADQLTSDLSQKARDRVLDRLRNHSLRFLIATDVAARGIDITNLSHVFNYEIPEDPESYVHRTGRTGRAGATGVAISLVTSTEKGDLKRISRRFEIDIDERALPTDEDVQALVSQRLTTLLEAKLRTRDKLQIERMKRLKPLARALSESEDEVALLAMVLDDYYQEILHAPPAVPEEDRRRGGGGKDRAEGAEGGEEEGDEEAPKKRRRRRKRSS
jgi:ATP-dependent RNA helicase DeaD